MNYFDKTQSPFSINLCFNPNSSNGTNSSTKPDKKKENGNKNKGFASLSVQERKAIAKRGGEARKRAAESGSAPSYSQIGQKGGKAGTKRKK